MNTILDKVRLALRRTTDAFDSEIEDDIKACLKDLKIAGVNEYTIDSVTDAMIIKAVKVYCKMYSNDVTDGEFDRLKKSYDELKAQLSMATGYTDWGTNEQE